MVDALGAQAGGVGLHRAHRRFAQVVGGLGQQPTGHRREEVEMGGLIGKRVCVQQLERVSWASARSPTNRAGGSCS
jgi:hypothetical protein